MKRRNTEFRKESDLVSAFAQYVESMNRKTNSGLEWVLYHETAGWDVLMAEKTTGIQIGIEAKLSLTAKAMEQALPSLRHWETGPDYRAVLVPTGKVQLHLGTIAGHLGLTILTLYDQGGGYGQRASKPTWDVVPHPPDENYRWSIREWNNWFPHERHKLPDYVPDVTGGCAAPLALTDWKIRAIKLMIVLDRTGHLVPADFKAIDIAPSRWTQYWLAREGRGRYVRGPRTPDFKAQHPENYAQIEADIGKWGNDVRPGIAD